MKIKQQTFLITGGASGLGASTAEYLVERGAHVVLADLNADAGATLVAKLGADKAAFSRCDVTSAKEVQAAVDLAVSKFGGLSGVVNCAGIVVVQKLLDRDLNPADLDAFARGVNINLIGSFNVARLAASAMAKLPAQADGERGVIINTASIAAFDGQVGQASYASSKAGVVSLALPLARELARHGIRVMTIAPGVCGTPMMQGIPEEARQQLEAGVPFPKRLGKPEEFASLVAHIIENTYLNGEVIRMDGAIRMV
ncbi:MAG TPA: SDR family NAD(P)-dependent oxidoreductase [Marinospirillum sp.]|uniref:SDR family NAD(P)-dependent oxidoreductase n=1 Tax=Marinospirillum sp. TaxID=2183934 RepID=UPI002B466F58|nr:SDR family NAD(P)-dependent oxidoreductase [Marinospirillum sp.]HKM14312.1 SDR family NAD(P)-dependent oxidoreductase [Marinospirillum sp.]